MSDDLKARLVRQLLRYEPDTGKLYWLPRAGPKAWNTRYAGKDAFTDQDSAGYRRGSIFSKSYLAHRIIWALHYGEWPNGEIDHINGQKSDNSIANLRIVSGPENQRNRSRQRNNTSGVVGVTWARREGKWQAQICHDRRNNVLGWFDCFDEAVAARKAAERQYGFHENHGR